MRGDPLGSVSPCASPRQEMLDAARRALSEAREEKSALREQLRVLRGERAALELRKEELEAQVRRLQEVGAPRPLALPPGCALCPSAHPIQQYGSCGVPDPAPPLQMLLQQEEKEAAALRGLRAEKRGLQERVGSLQSSLSQLEAERREAERSSLRLEKDNSALKKTLEKVSARRPSWHPWVLSGWPPRPYTSGDTNTAPQWLGTQAWFTQKQVGHGYKKSPNRAKSFPERKMRFVQRGHGCAGGVCACTRAFCAPERGV